MKRWLAVLVTLVGSGIGCGNKDVAPDQGGEMAFVRIDPGTFVMGSPSSEPGREQDEVQHQVTISKAFFLGKYEVTQGQWSAVMGTTPWSGQRYVQEAANDPATYISWSDAQLFIHKLNQAAGDSLYRLPTEAEWEYACRAGTATAWSFGNDAGQLGNYAWYDGNSWTAGEKYGHRVGTKKPNPWGLYDMHGNVWEWCQDWAGAYSGEPQTDPHGPAGGAGRVLRGGSFYGEAQYTRSADRGGAQPNDRDTNGVRLVRIK